MKHISLINEFREELSSLSREIETSSSMVSKSAQYLPVKSVSFASQVRRGNYKNSNIAKITGKFERSFLARLANFPRFLPSDEFRRPIARALKAANIVLTFKTKEVVSELLELGVEESKIQFLGGGCLPDYYFPKNSLKGHRLENGV